MLGRVFNLFSSTFPFNSTIWALEEGGQKISTTDVEKEEMASVQWTIKDIIRKVKCGYVGTNW